MKFTKLTLTIAGIFIASVGFSQSNIEAKTEARKISADNKVETKARPITNNDGYMDQSRKIMTKLAAKVIPSDFPKYKQGQTKEEYKEVIVIWMKNNLDLLEPTFKEKFKKKHGIK